ncbi:MAG: 4-(cytidine 5'-diphospho)-2-C-methyl-D-erythritol kinase [Alphaproteobacteria bacterium]|nr:4-(cytidine 5'-diphospho)-2-C-methyl-D-erythritol kinase [Alphaproteobacteria bacterium]
MRVRAPAKLNLFLHVGGRRADGYHELASLVAFAAYGDELHAVAAEQASLAIEGPFARGLKADEDNLVIKAMRALQQVAREKRQETPPVALSLKKNLPLASGIGGGSSDAAATLKLLSLLWDMRLGEAALAKLGLALGADLPVCVAARTMLVEGIGERLTPAPRMPPAATLLLNPGIEVPTARVFQGLKARSGAVAPALPPSFSDAEDLANWLLATRNDLEAPAIALAPAIKDCLDELRRTQGCLLARMSGSGATCFALYASEMDAMSAQEELGRTAPGWWSAATHLAA